MKSLAHENEKAPGPLQGGWGETLFTTNAAPEGANDDFVRSFCIRVNYCNSLTAAFMPPTGGIRQQESGIIGNRLRIKLPGIFLERSGNSPRKFSERHFKFNIVDEAGGHGLGNFFRGGYPLVMLATFSGIVN